MQDLRPDAKHAVVTTGQLIPTLAKLLICGLDAHVPADAIHSARNESKEHCFRLIEAAYGEGASYCVIGVLRGSFLQRRLAVAFTLQHPAKEPALR